MAPFLSQHTDTTKTLLIFGGIAVVGMILTALQRLGSASRAKRFELLRDLAESLGCEFDPFSVGASGPPYLLFLCFQRGAAPTMAGTVRGVWKSAAHPFPLTMGDYQYEIRNKNSTTTYRFSYLIFQLPFPEVPDLTIRRAGLLDHATAALGFERITFESAEFNRRFTVHSTNKKFAYDVVSPAVMNFILSGESFDLDIRGGFCCITGNNRCWSDAEFRDRLKWLEKFIKLWPAFLVDNLDNARE